MKGENSAPKMEDKLEEIVDNFPLPPPLRLQTEPLNDLNLNVPGTIKVSEKGELLKSYIVYQGFTGDILHNYNVFVQDELPQQIRARPLRLSEGYMVYFLNPHSDLPAIETTSEKVPLLPITARQRNLTYSSPFYADMVLVREGEVVATHNRPVFIGKIPVMVGSVLCHLHNKTDEDKLELGECPKDPLGYFIIKGTEKIVFIQEKLRLNRYLIFATKKGVVCRFTSHTPRGTTLIDLVESKEKEGMRSIRLSLHFLGKERSIPVFIAFRILLTHYKLVEPDTNLLEIIQWFVMSFVGDRHRKKITAVLQPSLLEVANIADPLEYLRTIVPKANSDSELTRSLFDELFPQMNQAVNKLYLLSLMTAQYAMYLAGLRGVDDRDSVANKRFETAGVSLQQLFGALWNKVITKAEASIEETMRSSKALRGDILGMVYKYLQFNIITDALVDTFTPGSWGIKGSYAKDNITDILNRESVLSTYAQVTKINTPTRRQAKQPHIRMVQMSQLGFIDPIETPEGRAVGLIKHKSVGALSSSPEDDTIIIERILPLLRSYYSTETPNGCLVNGKFIGWCMGGEMRDVIVGLRRRREIPGFTSVVLYYDGVVYISTDASRLMRPLLIVEGDTTVYEKKGLQGADFQTLLEEGAVEFVDAMEQDQIYIAQGKEQLLNRRGRIDNLLVKIVEARGLVERLRGTSLQGEEKGKERVEAEIEYSRLTDKEAELQEKTLEEAENSLGLSEDYLKKVLEEEKPYTHMEMDPNSLFSISASILPLPGNNMGPRNMYTCGMMKQALGIYHSNHNLRFDSSIKMLTSPTPPLFATQMNEWLGLNDLPAGDTVILALAPYYGYNQEDAFVFNKASIERGLFSYILYASYSAVAERKKDYVESFTRPQLKQGDRGEIYHALDENGVAKIGVSVVAGDVLISKTRKNTVTGALEVENVRLGIGEKGVVDRVLVDRNEEGAKLVKVKIREVRLSSDPVIGDKFSCLLPGVEVLTSAGWKTIDTLTLEDEVATLNSGRLVYERPSAVHAYDYEGTMYKASSDFVEQTVTPNHRMWVKRPGDIEFSLVKAEDCYGERLRFKKNVDYPVSSPSGVREGFFPTKGEDHSFTVRALQGGESADVDKSGDLPRARIVGREDSEPEAEMSFLSYKGKVYCCTVSSGVFYMRENGKSSWTGNSRYAQKGTIGLIVPEEDMPFNPITGLKPDIIANPLSIPSRMTIGKLMEIVASKLGALRGERVNATAFNNFNIKDFEENLHQYGFQRHGTEKLFSGTTGKPIESEIFIGPCYYMMLRHLVKSKMQIRSSNLYQAVSHQPVGGRAKGGALRIGGMERNAMLSHGSSSAIWDSFVYRSDMYETVFCTTCGRVSIYSTKYSKPICRNCGDKADFGRATIPYASRWLMNLLSGAGIEMRFRFSRKEE